MSLKLNYPLTDPKSYRSRLHRFLNSVNVPSKPPSLANREIISNHFEKAKPFNKFFASQCFHIVNSSVPPTFKLRKDKVIEKITINVGDIT